MHGPRPAYPRELTILDLLARNAATTPDAIALVALNGDGTRSTELTFSEMTLRVDDAAAALCAAAAVTSAQAVDGARWIMVVLPQGLHQVLAVWSAMRAGCGYVPVDADTSTQRLRVLIEETSPAVLIGAVTNSALASVAADLNVPLATFEEGGALTCCTATTTTAARATPPMLPSMPSPHDYALLLYSSGSTGTPKGIMYDHRWLMGGSWFVAQDMGLASASRCLLRCSYVWSVSLYDLYPATMMGGTLFIPPRGGHLNVQFIAETIERESIHAIVIQPTLLNLLLDEHSNSANSYPLRSLRHVVSSGEKLFTSTAVAFLAAPGLNARLWNMYGATEAGCTYFACQKEEDNSQWLAQHPIGVPAGVPQPYIDVYVMRHSSGAASSESSGALIDELHPVPAGETGEICFGGGDDAGFLARGYWKKPELTGEKFLHTRSYGRLYRTGDVGRLRDGQIVVEGRLDRQVKIHGVRIQPESIEAVLKRYQTSSDATMPIKACFVCQGVDELTAFVEAQVAVDIAAVMRFLRQELGHLYVPRYVVHLAEEGLPRTPSGKPDQTALRRMAAAQEDGTGGGGGGEQDDGLSSASTLKTFTVLGIATVTTKDEFVRHTWDVDLRAPAWKSMKDHRYKSEALCPGSVYVALASEACRAMSAVLPAWELRNLAFKQPLPLTPHRLMRVEAVVTATGAFIRIVSSDPMKKVGSDDERGWQEHCTCAAQRLDCGAASATDAMMKWVGEEYAVSSLYAELADGGFDYGVQFRVLRKVVREEGAATPRAVGEVARQQGSPFLLDPIDMDGCFQMAPLVSALGFQGAPTSIKKVQCFAACGDVVTSLTVRAELNPSDGSIDFRVYESARGVALFFIEGLTLQAFDSVPPQVLRVEWKEYNEDGSGDDAAVAAPRIIAIEARARADAETLGEILGATDVCTWNGRGSEVARVPLKSVVVVVKADEPLSDGVENLFPALSFDLPYRGRVWLLIVGESGGIEHWLCAGRAWAAAFPALLLSILVCDGVSAECRAPLLERGSPPPYINNGKVWRLALSTSKGARNTSVFAGMSVNATSRVAVMSVEDNALTAALIEELEKRGASARLVLPGGGSGGLELAAGECVVLSAIGDDASFSAFGRTALDELANHTVVTLAAMSALLPSARHSRGATASAVVVAESQQRQQRGSSSWVVYVPPLMGANLWFAPPAPAGFHRCTVTALVAALGTIEQHTDSIVGLPARETIPKQYVPCTTVVGAVERSAAEVTEFLRAELAESLGIAHSDVSLDTGLTFLGVTSLGSLQLSQRLRRFLGRDFSAFALQSNPTVNELVEALTRKKKATTTTTTSTLRRVLCLHGFRTSGSVLLHQLAPLHRILAGMGYSVVVPNAPHKTTGPAQAAEGLDLDDGDSFGWWTYDPDEKSTGHDGEAIGLDTSLEFLQSLGTFSGVVGFSQGGAVAAQVASAVESQWAVLFSPVYVPGHIAQCDCPTLVAFDPRDSVVGDATKKLVAELREDVVQVEHSVGHQLPAEVEWYAPVVRFLEVVNS